MKSVDYNLFSISFPFIFYQTIELHLSQMYSKMQQFRQQA